MIRRRSAPGRNVAGCAILAAILLLPHQVLADARLPRQVVPTEQAITLALDADKPDYRGATTITLAVTELSATIQFHSNGLSLGQLELVQNGRTIPTTIDPGEWEIVTVRAASPLSVGTATLRMDFTNTYDTTAVSLYRTVVDGQGYCFTQMEADEARDAFPCWDEPGFKIPYQLTISVPEGHTAVTNMPLEEESIDNGWRVMRFKKSPPMPSYLLAIATGPLEFTPIPGMSTPGNIVCIKGRSHLVEHALRTTPPLLAALERYFGSPYPYDKLDLIAVPEFWPGGMENPGAITFAEGILLLDPKNASVGQKRSQAAVIAHELAHMWFGDLVTMEWWDDLWLNESFASWMGSKVTHEVFPEYGMEVGAVRAASGAMITDARPSTRAIRQPVAATDNLLQSADELAYSKGEAVLGMFEAWLGPEVFRRGVIDYISQNAWKNATAQDLWAALTAASQRDFAATMATFVDQPGVPVVAAELTMDGKVRLSQRRFSSFGHEVGGELWAIPVQLKYADRAGTKSQSFLLDAPEATLSLESDGPPQWVMPNAGSAGYYRWTVPPQMLAALAEQGTQWLSVTERVGLIGNVSALLDAGIISGDDYLRTLNHFADDPNPQVISTLLAGLDKVKNAFVTEDLQDEFALYVRRTLGPALERFGMTSRAGEDEEVTRFRPQLIGWLGEEGRDPAVLAYADSLAQTYLRDPAAVDPAFAGTAMALTAQHGDRALFDECRRRFESAQIPQQRSLFLNTLGHFRDPALVEEALRYTLEGPLRPNEFFNIPFAVRSHPAHEQKVMDWTIANYESITAKLPPLIVPFLPYIAEGCSRDRLAAARTFFSDPSRIMAGTEESLAKITDQVNDCAGLREREGAKVSAYLKQFVAAHD
ncbi:MAG TPA: M1 family metallopeptidase [bacterium]|nr:M1 family metallopeptidase [bacterium]